MLTIAFISPTNTTIIFWFLIPSNTQGAIKLLQYFLKAENRKGGEGGVGNTDSIRSHPPHGQTGPSDRGKRYLEGEESTLNLPDPTQ